MPAIVGLINNKQRTISVAWINLSAWELSRLEIQIVSQYKSRRRFREHAAGAPPPPLYLSGYHQSPLVDTLPSNSTKLCRDPPQCTYTYTHMHRTGYCTDRGRDGRCDAMFSTSANEVTYERSNDLRSINLSLN